MKCDVLQIITIICVTHVQENFQIRTSIKQLLTKYQIFTKLPQIPHIHINRNFLKYICNFLDQLLHPYKFRGRDMSGILFFIFTSCEPLIKGCGMGPWFVLVSPCFRENVVATCKIECFLCSLDNLLQKNVIVLFFENQISKWRSFEKRAIFDLLFTFFSHQGKDTKFPSAHISLTYIHVFCSPY